MRLVIIASLVLVVVGGTHTQQAVTGAAAGGVTGAVVAGPLGAAVWCRGGGSTHHGK